MLIYEPSIVQDGIPQVQGVSRRLAELLYARGARDRDAMEAFLYPGPAQFHDPLLLKDMERAIARIRSAVKSGESICVYGDYDADGVCATAIMVDCLRAAGANVTYHIPSRHAEGYGLSMAAVERLHAQGVQLMVTVDNGVKAYSEIDRCRELGIDVVVTDHHRCDGRIPDCCAVICHTRDEDTYPNGDLCGAGIAYKLAEGMHGRDMAMKYLPIAGIATMADVVPLLGENRAMVALALRMINRGECSEGVKALGRMVSDREREYTARDLSFGFAPRLNAAGRMEEAGICVRLLLSEDPDEAREIAEKLDQLNSQRRAEEEYITDGAAAQIEAGDLTDKRCILLKDPGWNPGVIGIAASRISERYYRPTLLFSEKDGILTGSARSIPGVDLYKALNENAELYMRFGGHAYAAGVTMAAENFHKLEEALEKSFRNGFEEELFIPRRTYESEVELSELTLELAEELELMAPFGEGNPEPAFRTDGIELRGLRRIGATGSHIKATALKDDRYIDLVAFSQGHRFGELNDMGSCDAIYTPTVNRWQGMRSVQMRVADIRACEIDDPGQFAALRRHKFIDAFSRNVLYNNGDRKGDGEYPQDELIRLISGGIAGTAVLCFTPEGAGRMMECLKQNGVYRRVDITFGSNLPGPCAYNCGVLAPVLDRLELSRFRNILLYDSCDTGLMDKIARLAPNGRAIPGRGMAGGCFEELSMDRQGLAVYYRATAASERRFFNRGELEDYLAGVTKSQPYMARLAIDIMAELGFIREGQGMAFVKGAPARNLEESPTYRALKALNN